MAVAPDIQMFRHSLATLAYRGAKALNGVPPTFAGFRAAPSTRTPAEILAHIGDLLDWALSIVEDRHAWHDSAGSSWDEGVARFFAGLRALDDSLASASQGPPIEGLFQGPIADALTHIGQIAMLRGMAGCPVVGENYFVAAIAAGNVGREQAPPRREF